jgi:hypothetical protein
MGARPGSRARIRSDRQNDPPMLHVFGARMDVGVEAGGR